MKLTSGYPEWKRRAVLSQSIARARTVSHSKRSWRISNLDVASSIPSRSFCEGVGSPFPYVRRLLRADKAVSCNSYRAARCDSSRRARLSLAEAIQAAIREPQRTPTSPTIGVHHHAEVEACDVAPSKTRTIPLLHPMLDLHCTVPVKSTMERAIPYAVSNRSDWSSSLHQPRSFTGCLIRVVELMTVRVVMESGSGYDGGPAGAPGGGSPRVLIGRSG